MTNSGVCEDMWALMPFLSNQPRQPTFQFLMWLCGDHFSYVCGTSQGVPPISCSYLRKYISSSYSRNVNSSHFHLQRSRFPPCQSRHSWCLVYHRDRWKPWSRAHHCVLASSCTCSHCGHSLSSDASTLALGNQTYPYDPPAIAILSVSIMSP